MEREWEEQRTGFYLGLAKSITEFPKLSPHLYSSGGEYWFNGINFGSGDEAKILATQARDKYYKK